jgi:hypothetical protein
VFPKYLGKRGGGGPQHRVCVNKFRVWVLSVDVFEIDTGFTGFRLGEMQRKFGETTEGRNSMGERAVVEMAAKSFERRDFILRIEGATSAAVNHRICCGPAN